jgi:hypothetical protein
VTVNNAPIVLHYRERAESFSRTIKDLEHLDRDQYAPAIGLLAVHASIALADALLVALGGVRAKRTSHAEAAKELRASCTARSLPESGIKHFEWLLGNKHHFSYDAKRVDSNELLLAKVKMDQFFAWAFQTHPAVAQISSDDA